MYYTSYFGHIKKIKGDYTLVSITAAKPAFCGDEIGDWSFLGPSKELLYKYKNNEIGIDEYTEIYNKFLNDSWLKFKDFIILNQNKNIVMLCYEKPGDFCHRHLVSKFFNEHGIDCKEIE